MALITEDEIADLESKHGKKLTVIDKGEDSFVVRKPKYAEIQRFKAKAIEGPAGRLEAIRNIVVDCTVWPDKAVRAAVYEEYPLVESELSDEIMKLASTDVETKIRKR